MDSLFSTFQSFFFFKSLLTDAIKKSLKCMNETETKQTKTLQKVFTLHYWRFFWFKYFFFIILYYSDMFILLSSGKYNVGYRGEGLKHRKTDKNPAKHMYTLYVLLVVYCVWAGVCIFNPVLSCCCFYIYLNFKDFFFPFSLFFFLRGSLPRLLVWSMIENFKLQLLLSPF